jgi:L-2-hydroxyglutarate oxidase LhgO
MAEKSVKVPEFLREPLEAAQARLEVLEEETQRVLKDLMQRGKAGRREVGEIFEKLARQDWNIEELRSRFARFRTQGLELAAEWSDRARTEALERLMELQSRAISFLGVASREQVEELSKELERLAKRLEKGKRARRTTRRAGN